MTCASQLQHCPLCRAEIVSIVKEESDTPTSDDFLTWSDNAHTKRNLSNKTIIIHHSFKNQKQNKKITS